MDGLSKPFTIVERYKRRPNITKDSHVKFSTCVFGSRYGKRKGKVVPHPLWTSMTKSTFSYVYTNIVIHDV